VKRCADCRSGQISSHHGKRDLGFGAEDVQKIEPLLVTLNTQGQVEGVKYDRITVVLVNAIKEQ